jgi:hypothetical protein
MEANRHGKAPDRGTLENQGKQFGAVESGSDISYHISVGFAALAEASPIASVYIVCI